jgi:phenylacetate-coenzyme A ligase PaaK-like adenylate-forming protein
LVVVMDYRSLQRRHFADAMAQLSAHVARLNWSAEQIGAERDRRLTTLLKFARERSPWYRKRLAATNLDGFTAQRLPDLPPMTKDDLLSNFDDIVTDHRITLLGIEDHLRRLTTDAYLLDEHHAVTSSGTSGVRGIYVFDWAGWMSCFLSGARHHAYDRARDPALAAAPRVEGLVAAGRATHASSAQGQTFSDPDVRVARVPVTLPIKDIVQRLNALEPTTVRGYPSALDQLGLEARAGRLRIQPLRLRCIGEPLLPEVRERLERTWNAPVHSQWVASEAGTLGYSCPGGRGMHLNDDLTIVEPVDVDGNPVAPGTRSAKVYITNLANYILPLIRFEITDEVTIIDQPCPCGSAHTWIEEVQGRLDDSLVYPGGLTIHPLVVRSPLGRQRHVAEYQVHQTARGVEILLQLVGQVDLEELRTEIAAGLATAGLAEPDVVLNPVDHLDRHGSGKLKRVIPLPAQPPTRSPLRRATH